jgi:3-phosphoshikimate 1-carboxyvinyltransferase
MFLHVEPSPLRGSVAIPGSKSHTIRALVLAALADGESAIRRPLESLDTQAAVTACRAFGAAVDTSDPALWRVRGVAGQPRTPANVVDVANSGTTLYVALATACLGHGGWTVLTGDEQIRRRPVDHLARALHDLGAEIISTRGNGLCPVVARGPWRGGATTLEAITSQWVTAILLNAPLGKTDTHLTVTHLNEAPYVRMTLDWLESLGVQVQYNAELTDFYVRAGQAWRGFERAVAADFSSATFFLVAGAALDAEIELRGLDMNDSQGDKAVVDYLRAMGARVETNDGVLRAARSDLRGAELDLNATPDALPAMAVAAALARGTTRLHNVPQARVKETDRIAVMATELRKMGVTIEELPDGLAIEGRGEPLRASTDLCGHDDHRVVMALSLAALGADGPSRISTAEAVAVTFPTYVGLMRGLGARMVVEER